MCDNKSNIKEKMLTEKDMYGKQVMQQAKTLIRVRNMWL